MDWDIPCKTMRKSYGCQTSICQQYSSIEKILFRACLTAIVLREMKGHTWKTLSLAFFSWINVCIAVLKDTASHQSKWQACSELLVAFIKNYRRDKKHSLGGYLGDIPRRKSLKKTLGCDTSHTLTRLQSLPFSYWQMANLLIFSSLG